MTRRRTNSINIYDYPEHLNPFRDDVDDNSDKLNTVGRRRPSFRVNAWTLFSTNKGKSKTPEDNNVSSGTHSRFMTWTPKLLRKASFHRTSPESVSPISSQLAFRSSTLRSSLPPPNSRSTLSPSNTRSSSSQFTLSPSNSRRTFSPSRSTPPPSKTVSPPARPAPPTVRPPLSPRSTLSPGTPSAENAHIVLSVSPVKPSRKVSSSAGEQPSEDENKYVQQGARPKKKRRAPPPPSSGNTTSDNRQVNSNESDTSMTSSVTSTSVEEPLPQVNSSIATAEPGEVTQHGHEPENNSGEGKQQNPTDEQNSCNEKVVPQCNLQDGSQPQISSVNNNQPENMELTSRNDTNIQLVTDDNAEQSEEMQASSDYRDHEQMANEYHSQNKEIVFIKNTSENDPQQTVCILKDENHIAPQNGENGSEDGVIEGQQDESAIKNLKNSSKLHNGSHTSFPKNDIRNGMEKVTLTSQLMPEAKPRTILPNVIKD